MCSGAEDAKRKGGVFGQLLGSVLRSAGLFSCDSEGLALGSSRPSRGFVTLLFFFRIVDLCFFAMFLPNFFCPYLLCFIFLSILCVRSLQEFVSVSGLVWARAVGGQLAVRGRSCPLAPPPQSIIHTFVWSDLPDTLLAASDVIRFPNGVRLP
eukprot:RCo052682